ncbi:MAG: Holliday junction branch migration protein RuvA, partial [Planctomycetota bacterium]
MYEYLSGEVIRILTDSVTLDVAGVGYSLKSPSATLSKLREGSSARLFLSHRIRDDQMHFYGFSQPEERDLFERLCQVSGVGP